MVFLLAGCSARLPERSAVAAPEPIAGNEGTYMCPYTSDGTIAPWVRKGRAAKAGATLGSMAGEEVGTRALEAVPIIGGFLGRRAGEAAGRRIALNMVGGEEYMRETSDLSFNEIDDLIVYLYVHHSDEEEWEEVFELTRQIYPDVEKRWAKALQGASRG